MIIPFPPGGGTDMSARKFQAYLTTKNISLTPIYKSGAEGVVGTIDVAQQNKNTKIIGYTTFTAVATVLKEQPHLDFEYVSAVDSYSYLLVTNNKTKIKNFKDFENIIKNNKDVVIGTGGLGQHLSIKQLLNLLNRNNSALIITYKGAGQVLNDLIGGHIDIAFLPSSVAKPQIDYGNIKLLASTYEVPYKNITILSNKYKNWIDYNGYCIVLPKESDNDTINRWRSLVVEYINNTEYKSIVKNDLGVFLPPGNNYLRDKILRIKNDI